MATTKTKLAIVRARYDARGGPERFLAGVLPALEAAGFEATLIARSAEDWRARRLLKVDPPGLGRLWREASFARAARAAWRRQGFDLVHSHERIPGCDVFRAAAPLAAAAGVLSGPYARYAHAAEKEMFEHPRLRAVVCASQRMREAILHGFRVAPEKLHVIYDGVDLERFHPREHAARRGAARAALGAHQRDTVFALIGPVFAANGLGAAIDALAASGARHLWLVVAGADLHVGRFAARAREAGIGERVRFLGGSGDLRQVYAMTDCLLAPARSEAFPEGVLEALAMGLPAIVGRRCGAAEILRDGQDGWLCDPADTPGLARLLGQADQAMRDARVREAARACAERYGVGETAKQLAEIYLGLAGR
jgi:UDP-glucose:(heptosyl)LPS alpha-1,3-glucosyltransferase